MGSGSTKISGTECYEMDYSNEQGLVLSSFFLILAPLSMIGSLFMILSYINFESLRNPMFKVIFWLSVADFFKSLFYVIDGANNTTSECDISASCEFRGNIRNFFGVASFLWTGAIAFVVHSVIVKRRQIQEYKLHAVCWGIPTILLFITALTGAGGDAGYKCWITRDFFWLRWLAYYVPLILVWIGMTYFYYNTQKKLSAPSNETTSRSKVFLIYVGIFIFIRFWSVLDTTISTFAKDDPFFFAVLHCFFSPLQGLANAFVYGSSIAVRRQCIIDLQLHEYRAEKYPFIFQRISCCWRIEEKRCTPETNIENEQERKKTSLESTNISVLTDSHNNSAIPEINLTEGEADSHNDSGNVPEINLAEEKEAGIEL